MSSKTTFTVAGVFIAVWAVLGLMDVGNFTASGYGTAPDNTVTIVTPGGAAEAAGMQVGDRIVSIDGVDIEDSSAMSAMPRAAVGETRTIVVERGGANTDVSLTYAAQSSSQRITGYIGILTGLAFGFCGIWAFLTTGTRAARMLAMAGVALGIPLSGGPYVGAGLLGSIVGSIMIVLIILGFAKLLHFVLLFPFGNDPDRKKLYGPAALVAVIVVGLNVFQPNATGTLNTIVQYIFFAWIIGYLGAILFMMFRTWSSASEGDRAQHGLTTMMAGTGIGLGLLLLTAVIQTVAPGVTIPGSQWFGVAMVLVPVSCALAVVKSGTTGEA